MQGLVLTSQMSLWLFKMVDNYLPRVTLTAELKVQGMEVFYDPETFIKVVCEETNIARIAKCCPENIPSAINVSCCFY